MYPILVCPRSSVFHRVLERYTYAYIGIPKICTLRYTHCQAFRCHSGSVYRQQHLADEGSFAGDTLTDSSKGVSTKRGVVSAVADEDQERECKCGGGPTLRFSGGVARRQPVHWCRCRLRCFVIERVLNFDASADRRSSLPDKRSPFRLPILIGKIH